MPTLDTRLLALNKENLLICSLHSGKVIVIYSIIVTFIYMSIWRHWLHQKSFTIMYHALSSFLAGY